MSLGKRFAEFKRDPKNSSECLSKDRHSGSDALSLASDTLNLRERSAEFPYLLQSLLRRILSNLRETVLWDKHLGI
ncbi:hypothetical protein [Leptospira interrogans]|uniref:hypothetical protein n=1 Tax=Leptospira interrogans TaxID=173 RepID=UPI0012B52088|nr:hypothetical protein [Leptospira interrogans]